MRKDQEEFLNNMKNMQALRDEAKQLRSEKDQRRIHKIEDSTCQKEHQERLVFLDRMKKMKELRDLARKIMTGK